MPHMATTKACLNTNIHTFVSHSLCRNVWYRNVWVCLFWHKLCISYQRKWPTMTAPTIWNGFLVLFDCHFPLARFLFRSKDPTCKLITLLDFSRMCKNSVHDMNLFLIYSIFSFSIFDHRNAMRFMRKITIIHSVEWMHFNNFPCIIQIFAIVSNDPDAQLFRENMCFAVILYEEIYYIFSSR